MTTPAQQAILDRLTEVLEADERIVSAWLSGSLGRGEGDAWSDVDVTAVVEEEDIQACVGEYGGVRSQVGPTAHRLTLYGRVCSLTTPDCVRYDLTFVTPVEFRRQDPANLKPLVRASRLPTGRTPEIVMPAERIAETVTEFLRVASLLPVSLGREEWLVGLEGVALLRRMTVDLMVEANGKTHQRGGAKRLNAFLTGEQRAALEALANPTPDRQGIIEGTLGHARLFLPLARRLIAERGGAWPDAWEAAVAAHLRRAVRDDLPWPD